MLPGNWKVNLERCAKKIRRAREPGKLASKRVRIWPRGLKSAFSSPQGEAPEDDDEAANKSLGEANEPPPAGSCRNRHSKQILNSTITISWENLQSEQEEEMNKPELTWTTSRHWRYSPCSCISPGWETVDRFTCLGMRNNGGSWVTSDYIRYTKKHVV